MASKCQNDILDWFGVSTPVFLEQADLHSDFIQHRLQHQLTRGAP